MLMQPLIAAYRDDRGPGAPVACGAIMQYLVEPIHSDKHVVPVAEQKVGVQNKCALSSCEIESKVAVVCPCCSDLVMK